MNRILQAEVILTLTRMQAQVVLAALGDLLANTFDADEIAELVDVDGAVREQCAKQGVQL